MKKLLLISIFASYFMYSFSQEALKIQNNGSLTIQQGADLFIQGSLTLENGSSLVNNGTIHLQNNTVSNTSNWTDQSVLGALTGTGIVIFNSSHLQQCTGPSVFYTVYVNTNDLALNSNLNISNLLRLIKGRINTNNYVVALINTAAASLENDISNTGYTNSWINGNFRRAIHANTSAYDFPVGNANRSNLLRFINNNITGTSSLTSSFIPKPGTDAGLNVAENGNTYTAVNNEGVWKLVPDTAPTAGNYALHLYFNGFTGITDNSFGILRRPDASTDALDWMVPGGSLLEPLNGTGRKVSDGFARRYNIPGFSQFGIGQFNQGTPCEIIGQSQVCIASLNNIYSAPAGMTSYSWTVTGAGITGSTTNQTISIIAPNTPGTFTINLFTTLNGVPSQCSKTVTITATPTCDILGAAALCVLSNNHTYNGPTSMTTYSWAASPGLQITGTNTSAAVMVNAVLPGQQLLTLHATGPGGCVSQCSKLIDVGPVPPCNIEGASTVTTGITNISYTAPAGMSSYSWSVTGNGSINGASTGASVNITAGAAGSFILSLTTTINGCSRTCNKTVNVTPIYTYSCPVAGVTETCNGSTETFIAAPGLDGYIWTISGDGMIDGNNTNALVKIIATAAGSYTLTLQTTLNGAGCTSFKTIKVAECVTACSYTQGFYGNPKGTACYNHTGLTTGALTLMQAAFGINSSQVFGNVANKRFFTLFRTDITNGNIFKMLPGGGTPKAIDADKKTPFDGAYYDDQTTWSLVPLQPNGPQKGRIRNILLAQTMTLWFNIRNSSTLESISLVDDTLLTKRTKHCGSNIPVGEATKFGLPHSVVVYLNGGNGYSPTVEGLFALANDVLGAVVTDISPSAVNEAVDVINNAFDECRILTGTLPYQAQVLTKTVPPQKPSTHNIIPGLQVVAYPNPYQSHFHLQIISAETGLAYIEFLTADGKKVLQLTKPVIANTPALIPYTGPVRFAALIYKVTVGKNIASGIALKPN